MLLSRFVSPVVIAGTVGSHPGLPLLSGLIWLQVSLAGLQPNGALIAEPTTTITPAPLSGLACWKLSASSSSTENVSSSFGVMGHPQHSPISWSLSNT